MDAAEIDWELQARGQTVFQAAAEMFGEGRFARGLFGQIPVPTLHICAVDPSQNEIVELDQAAQKAGWGLTVTRVRYSYADLLGFYETLSAEQLPGDDVWVSFGLDDMANAIRFTLRRLDNEAMEFVRKRLPADAIRFDIQPRAPRAVAM
jgi:hypothetical protein